MRLNKLNKKIEIRAFLFIVLLVALSSLSFVSSSTTTNHVITAGWSIPEIVSNKDDYDDLNDLMVIDTHNNLHVIWIENYDFDHMDLKYRQKFAGNSSWSDISTLSLSEYNVRATLPKMKIDSEGIIHLVWKERNYTSGSDLQKYRYYSEEVWSEIFTLSELNITSEYFDFTPINDNELFFLYDSKYNTSTHQLYYRLYNWVSQSFGLEYKLTNSTLDFHYPSVAVDSHETVHFAWTDVVDSTNHEIHYQSFNGSLSPINPMIISKIDTAYAKGVQIFIDKIDAIHFLYIEDATYYSSYHYRILVWDTLGPDTFLLNNTAGTINYSLAFNSDNTAHLFWSDILDTYPPKVRLNSQQFTVSGSWSNIIQYNTSTVSGGHPVNTVDSNGIMHIIWNAYVDNDWCIYYINCTIQNVSDEAGMPFSIIFSITSLFIIIMVRKNFFDKKR